MKRKSPNVLYVGDIIDPTPIFGHGSAALWRVMQVYPKVLLGSVNGRDKRSLWLGGGR
jgi:hypothetical protein